MDDYNFNFEQRSVSSSERTDSDGGGMSFAFYEGRRQNKKNPDAEKEEEKNGGKNGDDAVEIDISSVALDAEPPVGTEAPSPPSEDDPRSRVGHKINITA